MAVMEKCLTDRYALYNGDSCAILPDLPSESIHFSIYSPPFALDSGGALYHYSSSDRDLSNSRTYAEFFEHYGFIVKELHRLTLPGRMAVVHCMDIPSGNSGRDYYVDFPGDIIRLHEKLGWHQASPRITIWKEPLAVRNRTMTKSLAHKTIVEDSCSCAVAGGDYALIFRRSGENKIPVTHPHGFSEYAGERQMPAELRRYKGWQGSQLENRYSHWIWRQYASCVWDDIRGNTGNRKVTGVVEFHQGRTEDDEKHLHPLQLDVIQRSLQIWTNPGETVLSPFAGVGSELVAALCAGRRAIGVELKPSYYKQALQNCEQAKRYEEPEIQSAMEFGSSPESSDGSDKWMAKLGAQDEVY